MIGNNACQRIVKIYLIISLFLLRIKISKNNDQSKAGEIMKDKLLTTTVRKNAKCENQRQIKSEMAILPESLLYTLCDILTVG